MALSAMMELSAIYSLALVAGFIYLYFIRWFTQGIHRARQAAGNFSEQTDIPLSIIISAHNEEEYIPLTLDSLAEQQYPHEKFEIVVIADRCTDNTVKIVEHYQNRLPMLHYLEITKVPNDFSPKKYAIHQGIETARHNHLVLLDADCQLAPGALKCFSGLFGQGFEAMVSIPKFSRFSSPLYKYYLPERILAWGIAAAAIGGKKPFLAFGTVWAYTRAAYQKAGGMKKIAHAVSGDDDLLVYQMGNESLPVAFCFNPQGWGQTRAPHTVSEFIRQRRRHHSAGKYYAGPVQWGYVLFHLGNLGLWLLPFFQPLLVLPLMAKVILDFAVLSRTAKIFHENLNLLQIIFFEIGLVVHHVLVAPLGFIGKISWGKSLD